MNCSIFFFLIPSQVQCLWILECIKKEHGAEEKTEIHLSHAWNCRSFFYFSDYVYLSENFNARSGSHGMYYGTLFLRTPFIYNVQCVIAGIWIVGAVWNLAKYVVQYLKFQKVLEKASDFVCRKPKRTK